MVQKLFNSYALYYNMRSLSLNKPDLTEFFQCLNTSPDVIFISETKLQKGADLSKVNIEGYKFFKTYTKMAFGGTGIYTLQRAFDT